MSCVHNTSGLGEIHAFSPDGQLRRVFSGSVYCLQSFCAPTSMCFGPGDELYVMSNVCTEISVLDTLGDVVRIQPTTLGLFTNWKDLAVEPDGGFDIVDGEPQIYHFAPGSASPDTISMAGWFPPPSDPVSIARDETGMLWVGDYGSGNVYRCRPDGTQLLSFNSYTVDGGMMYHVGHVSAMSCDQNGHVFVGQSDYPIGDHIVEVDTTGALVRAWDGWMGASMLNVIDLAATADDQYSIDGGVQGETVYHWGPAPTAVASEAYAAVRLQALRNPVPSSRDLAFTVTLPSLEPWRLDLFDAAGRRVAKLFDGRSGPGTVRVDATRAPAGARGILFARLSTPLGVRTARVAVLDGGRVRP